MQEETNDDISGGPSTDPVEDNTLMDNTTDLPGAEGSPTGNANNVCNL